jgi:hypothetical protein
MKFIGTLHNLTHLGLASTHISDVGLHELRHLKNIRVIDITFCYAVFPFTFLSSSFPLLSPSFPFLSFPAYIRHGMTTEASVMVARIFSLWTLFFPSFPLSFPFSSL